jgi:predicted nucleic acid-binding Zn ribbon protein
VALRHVIRCAVCGSPFSASRSDAATCSPVCRQRRARERQAREIEAAASMLVRQSAEVASLRVAASRASAG